MSLCALPLIPKRCNLDSRMSCFIESNALEKSRNVARLYLFCSVALVMLAIRCVIACEVECLGRNPY